MNAPDADALAEPLHRFLDRLAARTPTPGGGAAAALVGALSCGMGRMVAAYSDDGDPAVRTAAGRLAQADRMLRELVSEDMAAYERLRRAGGSAKNDPQAAAERQQALAAAGLVPLEMAATATAALSALDELKTAAKRSLISDLGVAAALGRACVESAAYSVRINAAALASAEDAAEMITQIDHLADRAAGLAESLAAFVGDALK